MFARMFLGNVRREARSRKWLGLLVIAVLPVVQGVVEIQQGVFRDRLDIVSVIQTSPLVLVLPLVVTTFTAGPTYTEVRNRFVSQLVVRSSPFDYVVARVGSAAVIGFGVGAVLALPALIAAFVVWPLLGDPAIDPSVYHLSATGAEQDGLGRYSFTELLAAGAIAYSAFSACWLGLGCAAIAVLGVLLLLVMRNRFLALALPFVLYAGESILTSVLGQERAAVMFAFFPYGLNQATLASLATGVVTFGAVTTFALWTMRRAAAWENLQ